QITLVAVMGVVYAANQTITLGDFIIFFSYETMIVWPIRQIGRLLSEMGKTKVSIGRLMEILDEPQEDLTSGEEVEILGKIEFQDVHFSYQDDKHIVDGVNLIIEQGETVAILGPTASGKSTLISLLNRLYEPVSGRILIDDIPLSKINKKCLRNQIGLVLQEPFLYSKSIFQNIQLANRQMDKQMIEHAANSARVHDDIVSFDQGYETLVGEKGVTLSGGQKQRIAIARTIINKTPIIIFDDSLSAVDSETDKGIRDALKQLNANTTTIIITQRVNSAMSADKIVILEHGKISAVGTHDELIHQDGLYKRIYEIQSRMVSEEEV
ncbi:MAG: ABC transporter ATP-binding protein, partial [Erysipelotrichaceae bacterium]